MFVALLIVTYYMTYKTHQNCSQVQALKNPSIRCAGIIQISLNYFLNLSTYLVRVLSHDMQKRIMILHN